MHPSLRGYIEAVVGPPAATPEGARVADDVNAVAHLVSRTNQLAVTLTDFAVPAVNRAAVLDDLLRQRVHPLAARVARHAVLTEPPDELLTSLHDAAELCRHRHELDPDELSSEEPPLSRLGWRAYAGGFATAVFEDVPEAAQIEEVEDELFRFTRTVESHPALRAALADPARPSEARQRLIAELLEGKARPATVRLAQVAVEGRVRDLVAALDWLVEQAAQARGWRVARVRTARPVDAEERRSLSEAMEHLTGRPVELQVTEDPELIGGAVVQIGDLLVDATTRHRLDQLQEHLLGPEGATRGASD